MTTKAAPRAAAASFGSGTRRGAGRVLVGWDGSGRAHAALAWAAGEAARRQATMRIVRCSVPVDATDFYGVGDRALSAVETAAAALRERHPGLVVEAAVTVADARDALADEVSRGDLLVVGASGSGTIERALLGSVPRTVSRRTPCPLVVHRDAGPEAARLVVVALDGSAPSIAALEHALVIAERDGAEVVLTHAWGGHRARGRSRVVARSVAQGVLDDAELRCDGRDVAIRTALLEGDPADAIRTVAQRADLIVVGTRGRGALRTRFAGSVALALVDDAPSTVMVVPAPR
jgi:nucleotide-binding universal stress UspA family protein